MNQLIEELVKPKVLSDGRLESVTPIRLKAANALTQVMQQWQQDKAGRLAAEKQNQDYLEDKLTAEANLAKMLQPFDDQLYKEAMNNDRL
jgi:hypothetical protein